jgi:hypothetical protein
MTEERSGKRAEVTEFLTLKMEEGVTCQGIQAASRSWRGKGTDPALEPAEGT